MINSPASSYRYRTTALVLLWFCFAVRGLYYAAVMPLWEGFDEYSHFAFVQHLLHEQGLPVPGVSRQSAEVESSLHTYPVPWALSSIDAGVISYEAYWRLPEAQRRARLASLQQGYRADPGAQLIYESQQPPLYYWLMAPVLAVGEWMGLSLISRVFLLRAASVVLCSLALPLGFALVRRVEFSEERALAIAAVATVMPGLMIDVVRVGNDSLAVVIFTALTYGCVVLAEAAPGWCSTCLLGATLGCGLLTKSYFLTAVPAVCVVYLARRRASLLPHLATVLAIAAAISAWWYQFIYRATGDLTGQIQSAGLRGVPLGERLRVALHLDWWRGIDTALFSYLWTGGWSFLQLRSWIYHLFYLVLLAGAVGIVVAAVRGQARRLAVPALVLALFCTSLAYHMVLGQIGYGKPMTNGWYLYCLVFAELILLCAGLAVWLPRGREGWAPTALAGLFALLDLYAVTLVQVPYYRGITAHAANGRVPALAPADVPRLLHELNSGWLAYAAATLSAAAIACAVRRHYFKLAK